MLMRMLSCLVVRRNQSEQNFSGAEAMQSLRCSFILVLCFVIQDRFTEKSPMKRQQQDQHTGMRRLSETNGIEWCRDL